MTIILQSWQGAAKLSCSHDSREKMVVLGVYLRELWSFGSAADLHPAAELETQGGLSCCC